jgi:hypothetical protein
MYINFRVITFVMKLDQKNKKIANDPQHAENCFPRNVKKIRRSKCGNATKFPN